MRPHANLAMALIAAMFGVTGLYGGKKLNGFEIVDPLIPEKEIRRGGPGRDGIMALSYPSFVNAEEADYLSDSDRVLGVAWNGEAKAYPIGLLNRHEIVNDILGGLPVAVSYCPLCGSGLTFQSPLQEGKPFNFGVSGLLYNSDVLLFDRQTESLWSQIMMKSVNGPLKGAELSAVPTANTTWGEWKERHPQTKVVKLTRLAWNSYKVDPYGDYESDSALMFPVAENDKRYHRKAPVIGIVLDGLAKAYPFVELEHEEVPLKDEMGDQTILVHYNKEINAARITAESGEELSGSTMYWFAWYAFHPDTEVFQSDKVEPKHRKRLRLDF